MSRKIPTDAFAYYLALGPGRSYAQVAEHFGVSKTAVANAANPSMARAGEALAPNASPGGKPPASRTARSTGTSRAAVSKAPRRASSRTAHR